MQVLKTLLKIILEIVSKKVNCIRNSGINALPVFDNVSLDCPEWKVDYDYGDDYYHSIVYEEDCRKTEKVSKWLMDSPAVCQRACLSDRTCVGFTFKTSSRRCALFNASGVKRGRQRSDHISGMRDSCLSGEHDGSRIKSFS